jgi:hypothetical protein
VPFYLSNFIIIWFVFDATYLKKSMGIVGFHMMRKTLNQRFPLKDERLFDDLKRE